MDIAGALNKLETSELQALLGRLLEEYAQPAFGVLPKREVDLMIYRTLRDAGVVAQDTPLYQLMADLRVSRSKARNLMFDLEIRQTQSGQLDDQVRSVIMNDSYFRDANWFVLEVENPVVQAHLREICRRARVVTDASFNPSLVRLPVSGLASVLEEFLTKAQQAEVKRGLYRAGKLDDPSFRGLMKRAMSDLAGRFAGKVGGEVMDGAIGAVGEFLQPILSGDQEAITDIWSGIYS
ncbi:hypothetical protein [Donghicola eburneus]|uniref:Uncharacterized protein n=1 Tax=Donghicola eburneus TaxID=393278 RepID=A0A1M4N2E0_9RHOB|nr:hypothetical protein [Donghicola eburneus]SCM69042.1 hypothetical protein KARMA_3275 [Donghicola eburneus]SFQ37213.1 hypothetical protein SAMN05421764_103177 [Donghicola eburneus]